MILMLFHLVLTAASRWVVIGRLREVKYVPQGHTAVVSLTRGWDSYRVLKAASLTPSLDPRLPLCVHPQLPLRALMAVRLPQCEDFC